MIWFFWQRDEPNREMAVDASRWHEARAFAISKLGESLDFSPLHDHDNYTWRQGDAQLRWIGHAALSASNLIQQVRTRGAKKWGAWRNV